MLRSHWPLEIAARACRGASWRSKSPLDHAFSCSATPTNAAPALALGAAARASVVGFDNAFACPAESLSKSLSNYQFANPTEPTGIPIRLLFEPQQGPAGSSKDWAPQCFRSRSIQPIYHGPLEVDGVSRHIGGDFLLISCGSGCIFRQIDGETAK